MPWCNSLTMSARHLPSQGAEWRSAQRPPDLDAIAMIASTCGVDLNPLDASVEADRRWLEALIWPEDRDKAALLHDALTLAARVPVEIMAGDAVGKCPAWSARVPAGEPRIVFHCATRMHVPVEQRAMFDRAIDDIGHDAALPHRHRRRRHPNHRARTAGFPPIQRRGPSRMDRSCR
jgi:hypothetical protein